MAGWVGLVLYCHVESPALTVSSFEFHDVDVYLKSTNLSLWHCPQLEEPFLQGFNLQVFLGDVDEVWVRTLHLEAGELVKFVDDLDGLLWLSPVHHGSDLNGFVRCSWVCADVQCPALNELLCVVVHAMK